MAKRNISARSCLQYGKSCAKFFDNAYLYACALALTCCCDQCRSQYQSLNLLEKVRHNAKDIIAKATKADIKVLPFGHLCLQDVDRDNIGSAHRTIILTEDQRVKACIAMDLSGFTDEVAKLMKM
jgi:hypothetical protein